MTGFPLHWLDLREPHDHRARSNEVLEALRDWRKRVAAGRALRIVDLGCGTGSTARYLTGRLTGPLQWCMVDNDPDLLAVAATSSVAGHEPSPCLIRVNLADADPGHLLEHHDLVAASALLDLVSQSWLERLWDAAETREVALLAALAYDGRIVIEPAHPVDPIIVRLVNRHQTRDKGFGPALGPSATAALAILARRAGWTVLVSRSDWVFAREQNHEIAGLLLTGWADAAREVHPLLGSAIDLWLHDRLTAAALRIRVGHQDLFACPPAQALPRPDLRKSQSNSVSAPS